MDSNTNIDVLAEIFQALSDPNRLRILELLRNAPCPICVNGIAHHIGVTQSAVSQHLKILRQHGLVSVKKEGYFKHYSVNLENLDKVRSIRESILGENFRI